MKILRFIQDNILFITTLFLLAFIPLYPKIPLLNVQNTWVYVRLEDVVVLLSLTLWVILHLLKKVTLKTPLTLPIMLFWIIGGIATLHGVLLFFPTLPNVFPNVAFLSYLRRIEYMSLFFIAYASIKEKKFVSYVIAMLTFVLLSVVGYGFGQRFLGFPAYLTMNEEFAKGIPIHLSTLSRVPSTFAGHYDLAAYLVLVIPILVSVAFGFKNWLVKIFLLISACLGFALLFMTVSRVSFLVLLLSLVMLLIFQRKKIIIVSLLALTLVFLILSPMLLERFASTLSEANILVDTKTGYSIGQVKIVAPSYFDNKKIIKESYLSDSTKAASPSAIFPLSSIPSRAAVIIEPNRPNGESLPQGTSYVNLYLSPVTEKLGMYFYQKSDKESESKLADVYVVFGEFVVKRAKAYDLSFTTRFQGEWPRTLLAFERNILLGSGYGSVSLAVDNDYLRALGESGLLGFLSFISIFLIAGIYIKKILPKVHSAVTRSFIFGFIAGTFGLSLNAAFIDVFEASKVAFVYWLLMGIVLGILYLYKSEKVDLYKEFKDIITSSYAIIIYLLVATSALFFTTFNTFFVGDDFTWLAWASKCSPNCFAMPSIINYFTQAAGFFYRPGAKLYFDFMYRAFWLNQAAYHSVSIFLHFAVSVLIFVISKRIFKNHLLSALSAFLFLILSGYSEAVLWISSTGFLFTSVFALLSLLSFIYWRENKKEIYFIFSLVFMILGPLFHEVGIVTPFLIILYDVVTSEKSLKNVLSGWRRYAITLFPILPYLFLRYIAQSHWLSGDYSYNFVKLPYNFVGNAVGYIALIIFGPASLSFYEKIRAFSRNHLLLALLGAIVMLFILVGIYRIFTRKMEPSDKRVVIFGFLFFVMSLLPFLGLGNIASRYSYLSSFGIVVLVVLFLKKVYDFLLGSGKYIAIAGVTIIIIIFSAAHLFQLQKIQGDWLDAGGQSKNFLTALNYVYAHYSEADTARLYFVNVPIRSGEAWVFPTGLSDAAWLMFRNPNMKVYQTQSAVQAFQMKGDLPGRVFEFDNDGNLVEKLKMLDGSIVSVKK